MAKPTFTAAWTASQQIYSASDSARKVADVVGGRVAENINDKTSPWRNTCAVRMSYILNKSGLSIPPMPETRKGGDGQNYFFRVRDLVAFLKRAWGAPEVVAYPPGGGGALAGKSGLILFEIQGWSDASGHATLFNGSSCYDHCYFNEPGVNYRTAKANFWELKK
ncbi:type VI secretion system amidase effector protein Tae4 [Hydrogenophaga palleronii]|uniref:type VI secretion system amidase effector protein Tae4 n=1 Tax=Hydrogenophaga palleronii TaxID=65655 RepID=UPI0008270F18|nr:type VI secretion system amidase effector protein Tae4 [Hydrogenophaga palleronii]